MFFRVSQKFVVGRNPVDIESQHPAVVSHIRDAVASLNYGKIFSRDSRSPKRTGKQASPEELNDSLEAYFKALGWSEFRRSFYTCDDEKLNFEISGLPSEEQKSRILGAGLRPSIRRTQTDFLVDRIALENQFGKFFSIFSDITTKNPRLKHWGLIDCGITLVPGRRLAASIHGSGSFEMAKDMFTSMPRYEHPNTPTMLLGFDIFE